jgi:hypothetical protein
MDIPPSEWKSAPTRRTGSALATVAAGAVFTGFYLARDLFARTIAHVALDSSMRWNDDKGKGAIFSGCP